MAYANKVAKGDWTEVDTTTLPAQLSKPYSEYLAARKLAADKREAFEAVFKTALKGRVQAGSKAVFGYNFGKLSMAIVPDDDKPKASAKAVSFNALTK
jgi:hypothetical protein